MSRHTRPMTTTARNAEAATGPRGYPGSARLAVVMVRVAVVVAMAVVFRTLTGPLGRLSTARLPQVPAAA
jgi:hypothetical protein